MHWLMHDWLTDWRRRKGAMLSCPLCSVPDNSRDLIGVQVGTHKYRWNTYKVGNLADKGKVYYMDVSTRCSIISTETIRLNDLLKRLILLFYLWDWILHVLSQIAQLWYWRSHVKLLPCSPFFLHTLLWHIGLCAHPPLSAIFMQTA